MKDTSVSSNNLGGSAGSPRAKMARRAGSGLDTETSGCRAIGPKSCLPKVRE